MEGSCKTSTEKVVEFGRKEVSVSSDEQLPRSDTCISQGSVREANPVGHIC